MENTEHDKYQTHPPRHIVLKLPKPETKKNSWKKAKEYNIWYIGEPWWTLQWVSHWKPCQQEESGIKYFMLKFKTKQNKIKKQEHNWHRVELVIILWRQWQDIPIIKTRNIKTQAKASHLWWKNPSKPGATSTSLPASTSHIKCSHHENLMNDHYQHKLCNICGGAELFKSIYITECYLYHVSFWITSDGLFSLYH